MDDRELLVRMDEKLDALQRAYDKSSNGVGFPRCVERDGRLLSVETKMKDMLDSQKWAWRTIIVTGGTLLVKTVWSYVTTGAAG